MRRFSCEQKVTGPVSLPQVVQLANRKGFCKHALRAGSPIVPVYIFGQTQLFFTFTGRLQDVMRRLSRALRVSLIPFVGRSWLSPFVPLQNPLTVVAGEPINVGAEPIDRPSAEQVRQDLAFTRYCHHQYCMVYGIQMGGRWGGGVYCAMAVQ